MAAIDMTALERLRRVFDDGAETPALMAQALVELYALGLEPGRALELERWMTCVASAAEELGQDADASAILALAHTMEAKLS